MSTRAQSSLFEGGEEQNIVSQILREQLHNPELERQEVRQLRKFLKQPLVGASVQSLRDGLKVYSSTNEVLPLIEVVRELYEQQGLESVEPDGGGSGRTLSREDLHLVCFEYVTA